jgi:hypothetical protein
MNDLNTYIEKLELIAFFSAFPLVYLLVQILVRDILPQKTWLSNIFKRLPITYALVSFLFLGMKMNQMIQSHFFYFNYSNLISYLEIWAYSGVLFFVPSIGSKPKWSLIHSIPFISLILFDIAAFFLKKVGNDVLQNEMRLYFTSTILYVVVTLITTILSTIWVKYYTK